MTLLNRPVYAVEKDRLIYDAAHPIDATTVQIAVPADGNGMIKRGQLLDCTDGVYGIHAETGDPSAIVAEDTSYAADDTEVAAVVYISGSFRESEIFAEPGITAADKEVLRSKGIYLK